MATPGNVNRAQLESFYQNPGQVYDDLMTEGAFGVLADQIDANAVVFSPNGSASVPSAVIPGVAGTNVYAQLVSLEDKIQQLQAGVIPSGSITTAMLQDMSVTVAKIKDLAVTFAKLSPDLQSTITAANKWRITNGDPEYYNGTEWMSVGGGVMVASSTVKESFPTERSISDANQGMLIYKLAPKYTGEMVVSFELKSSDTGYVYVHLASSNKQRGWQSTGGQINSAVPAGVGNGVDYRVAVGAKIQHPAEAYMEIAKVVGTTYTPFSTVIQVTEAVPIYIFLRSNGPTGTINTAYIKNLEIKYDVAK